MEKRVSTRRVQKLTNPRIRGGQDVSELRKNILQTFEIRFELLQEIPDRCQRLFRCRVRILQNQRWTKLRVTVICGKGKQGL